MSGKKFKPQYIIHGETKVLNLTPEDKLSDINNIVCVAYKININDYELLYGKTRLSNYDKQIKDIVGKNESPIFNYNKLPKLLNKQSNKVTVVKTEGGKEKVVTITKVTVEHYPSRPELLEHLDKFVSTATNKDHSISNADSIVEVKFKDSVRIYIKP
jgi:hypothetical protein